MFLLFLAFAWPPCPYLFSHPLAPLHLHSFKIEELLLLLLFCFIASRVNEFKKQMTEKCFWGNGGKAVWIALFLDYKALLEDFLPYIM